MATLIPWMQQVAARVSNVPEPNVEAELAYVVKDFCRESLAWRKLLQDYAVTAGEEVVTLNPEPNEGQWEVIQVLRVFINGMELSPASELKPLPNAQGTPTAFTCDQGPAVITLLPTPSVSVVDGLGAYVALAPRDPATFVPDFFVSQHFEAILDGTLGRFFMQPNRPYTNEKAAAYHLQRYRNKTREAWAHALRGNTTHAVNWAFPPFGV